jgi:DNA-binding CsgD family transcriptional regulator
VPRAPERASELARALDIGSIRTLAGTTRGLLELGTGTPREAIAVLRDTARFSLAHGLCEPGVSMWAGDLAEAYARADVPDEAQESLAILEKHATANRRSAALAVVARLQGILAAPDVYADRFDEALEWHHRMPLPFEVARTHLCFGERLRRERQRIAARRELRTALDTFERLGAEPWAQRARVELRAAGEAAAADRPETADLTPQELQVALLVSGGATNREAAAALFLSPKTVEVHLTHVYRKLGVRSRTELARVLGQGPAPS